MFFMFSRDDTFQDWFRTYRLLDWYMKYLDAYHTSLECFLVIYTREALVKLRSLTPCYPGTRTGVSGLFRVCAFNPSAESPAPPGPGAPAHRRSAQPSTLAEPSAAVSSLRQQPGAGPEAGESLSIAD